MPSASRTASSKNALGLLPPDLQPRGVEDRLQAEEGGRIEAAAEVARRGGVGNAAGAQGVEVRLVAPQQFEVFQAGPSGQQVVGDVQHVVGIVIGQMDLQQAEAAIDGLVEAELLGQQMDGPDAAVGGRSRAFGDFIMDVRGGHDGPIASAVVVLVQSSGDPPLASFDLFSYLGVHSKTSVIRNRGRCFSSSIRPKTPKVFEFFHPTTQANPSGFA